MKPKSNGWSRRFIGLSQPVPEESVGQANVSPGALSQGECQSSRRREEAEHKAAHFRGNLRLLTSAATVCHTLSMAVAFAAREREERRIPFRAVAERLCDGSLLSLAVHRF